MLSTWWVNLLDGLGHYVIRQVSIAQIIMMTNNITTLGYTYANLRLNNLSNTFYQIAHIS